MLLQLGSEALGTLPASTAWQGPSVNGTATPSLPRRRERRLRGDVGVVLFDFDGTLTATPGDRAERKFKIAELEERAPMLEPWLSRLREAGIMLGIMTKSSEETVISALHAAGLRALFDGPVRAKAVGLEGKAGFIRDMCVEGGCLAHLAVPPGAEGAEGAARLRRVLLVDDDIGELKRAAELAIQTYPPPETGGLQEEDFYDLFDGLGLPCPMRPAETLEIHRLWTCGMTGHSLGLSGDRNIVDYEPGNAPLLTDFYRVLERNSFLGEGSFGVCKGGVHLASGKPCAIKFIRKENAGRNYLDNFVERDEYTFLLNMARRNPHKNVVRQLDYLMGATTVYNAMELLEGPDLLTFLQRTAPITEGFAKRLMRQLLSALRHIHNADGRGLIHRDVKLDNLRFRGAEDPKSDVVLVDFGLSCPAQPDQRRGVVGTMLYMAPEVFSNHYSTQVDLWSAGVLLYIVLTGRPPWTPDPEEGLRLNTAVARGTALEAALGRPEIDNSPPPAVDLLRGLLVVTPSSRLTAASGLKHEWFSIRCPTGIALNWEQDAIDNVIDVKGSTYGETRGVHARTPKARLGLLVALEEQSAEARAASKEAASNPASPESTPTQMSCVAA